MNDNNRRNPIWSYLQKKQRGKCREKFCKFCNWTEWYKKERIKSETQCRKHDPKNGEKNISDG